MFKNLLFFPGNSQISVDSILKSKRGKKKMCSVQIRSSEFEKS